MILHACLSVPNAASRALSVSTTRAWQAAFAVFRRPPESGPSRRSPPTRRPSKTSANPHNLSVAGPPACAPAGTGRPQERFSGAPSSTGGDIRSRNKDRPMMFLTCSSLQDMEQKWIERKGSSMLLTIMAYALFIVGLALSGRLVGEGIVRLGNHAAVFRPRPATSRPRRRPEQGDLLLLQATFR